MVELLQKHLCTVSMYTKRVALIFKNEQSVAKLDPLHGNTLFQHFFFQKEIVQPPSE